MFTLKFIGHDGQTEMNLCCPRYEVDRTQLRVSVTAYKELSGSGIEYWVAENDHCEPHETASSRDYSALFVTNEAGKTIDTVNFPRRIPDVA